jgi:ACT domain-containing protein
VGQESLTVPAGTFNVYKVTSDMTISNKTVINLSFDFQTVSYRVPEVLWDIKTETYRKDKLMGYSLLTKLF